MKRRKVNECEIKILIRFQLYVAAAKNVVYSLYMFKLLINHQSKNSLVLYFTGLKKRKFKHFKSLQYFYLFTH